MSDTPTPMSRREEAARNRIAGALAAANAAIDAAVTIIQQEEPHLDVTAVSTAYGCTLRAQAAGVAAAEVLWKPGR